MASEASNHCANLGKISAYTVYNLGVGILIGLVRTIIAVAYVAKHAFYAKAYKEAHNHAASKRFNAHIEKQVGRDREVRAAKKETRNAKGLAKVGKWFRQVGTQAKHTVGEFKDEVAYEARETVSDVKNTAVQSTETARKEEWYGQLFRGVTELLYVGAPYYSYQDNFSKEHKASTFALSELAELIQNEREFDSMIQDIVGKDNYNPLF